MSKKKVGRLTRGRYRKLINDIGRTVENAKNNAAVSVNKELVYANWNIGRHIVEFEQNGNEKATYGSELLNRLSSDLILKFGKGFGKSNIYLFREFYLLYPIFRTVSGKLSWSHFALLVGISDKHSRNFYAMQTEIENWSVRELARQINSSLFERFSINRNKKKSPSVQRKRKIISNPRDIIKDPYVLDFLGIKKEAKPSEKKLEQLLHNNMQRFILELGKGFAFIARQFKIPIGKKPHSVDLVFYNRILKCFVLFDLKTRPFESSDVGQMNTYLNYFIEEENMPDDNEPIGIILSAEKDAILVEYALGGISRKNFVSKYLFYLPDKKDLQKELTSIVDLQKKKSQHKLKSLPARRTIELNPL